jgi:hypothetical protein
LDSFVVGAYNVIEGSTNSWVSTDDLFVVGNGTSSAPSDALRVKKNGDTTVNGVLCVTGGLRVTGTLSLSGAAAPPANTTTPVGWQTILSGTSVYKVPVYQ